MRAIVIGGGIGGVTAALALRKAGIETRVFERAPGASEVGAGISMWGNAIRALDSIGAAGPVLARGEPMRIAEMKSSRGRVQSRMDMGGFDRAQGVTSVIIHRAELLDALLSQLPSDCVRFGHELVDCQNRSDSVVASFANGVREEADVLIGADGLRSRVREVVHGKQEPRYSGYTCFRGVVEWKDHSIVEPGHISESWGAGSRFGVIRMTQNRIYWFGTWNAPPMRPGEIPRNSKDIAARIFAEYWRPIPEIIAATDEARVLRHDIVDREPRRGWSEGRITLLGDAAHPTTPNVGQGGCLAIEDGIVLARVLASFANPIDALSRYESLRFDRCAQITNFSWRLGIVGQWANPLVRALRDLVLRHTPQSGIEKQHARYVGFDVVSSVDERPT